MLVGKSGVGKSWLIQYLLSQAPTELGSRFSIAYVDLKSLQDYSVAGLVRTYLAQLAPKEPYVHDPDPLVTLQNVLLSFKRRRLVPIICLDSFEHFFKVRSAEFLERHFFDKLRALSGMRIGFVVASQVDPVQLVMELPGVTSPFGNNFKMLEMRPFNPAEARRFAETKGNMAGFSATENTRMLELGQNIPLRMQLAGQLISQARSHVGGATRAQEQAYWDVISEVLDSKYQQMTG
jgi:hypothetical protein